MGDTAWLAAPSSPVMALRSLRTCSTASLNRNVFFVELACVVGARPEDPVVFEILHHARRPSRDAGNREQRREHLHRHLDTAVNDARIEVDVRENALLLAQSSDDFLFQGRVRQSIEWANGPLLLLRAQARGLSRPALSPQPQEPGL